MAQVVVVEDYKDAADLMADLLRTFGHEVRVAQDEDSALAAASALTPDVVLVDIGLPSMTGFDLARRLKAICGPATRFVACTGLPNVTPEELTEAGFDDVLTKPFSMERLRNVTGIEIPR